MRNYQMFTNFSKVLKECDQRSKYLLRTHSCYFNKMIVFNYGF